MEQFHVAAGNHQRKQVWQVLTVATAGLQSRYNAQWTLVMAATTVAIVPLIVLFVALGRHIVRSIVVTGLK